MPTDLPCPPMSPMPPPMSPSTNDEHPTAAAPKSLVTTSKPRRLAHCREFIAVVCGVLAKNYVNQTELIKPEVASALLSVAAAIARDQPLLKPDAEDLCRPLNVRYKYLLAPAHVVPDLLVEILELAMRLIATLVDGVCGIGNIASFRSAWEAQSMSSFSRLSAGQRFGHLRTRWFGEHFNTTDSAEITKIENYYWADLESREVGTWVLQDNGTPRLTLTVPLHDMLVHKYLSQLCPDADLATPEDPTREEVDADAPTQEMSIEREEPAQEQVIDLVEPLQQECSNTDNSVALPAAAADAGLRPAYLPELIITISWVITYCQDECTRLDENIVEPLLSAGGAVLAASPRFAGREIPTRSYCRPSTSGDDKPYPSYLPADATSAEQFLNLALPLLATFSKANHALDPFPQFGSALFNQWFRTLAEWAYLYFKNTLREYSTGTLQKIQEYYSNDLARRLSSSWVQIEGHEPAVPALYFLVPVHPLCRRVPITIPGYPSYPNEELEPEDSQVQPTEQPEAQENQEQEAVVEQPEAQEEQEQEAVVEQQEMQEAQEPEPEDSQVQPTEQPEAQEEQEQEAVAEQQEMQEAQEPEPEDSQVQPTEQPEAREEQEQEAAVEQPEAQEHDVDAQHLEMQEEQDHNSCSGKAPRRARSLRRHEPYPKDGKPQ